MMGATLGYLILPVAIQALFGFTPDAVSNLVRFDDYLDFVLRIILFVGLAFELPIFLLTFNLIGFLRGSTILKPWRAWIFSICLAVAALSPTADPLSMVLLSAPLILFYFMAGGIALVVDKKRDRKAESIETGSARIEAPTSITE
jgi:sec-independent protein translocase protein TatC